MTERFDGMRQRQPRNYDAAAAEMRGDADYVDGDPPDEADENLTEQAIEEALTELLQMEEDEKLKAPSFEHMPYGLGYTITKTEREKRIDELATTLSAILTTEDEDIVYEAVDELREMWRVKEGRGTGYEHMPPQWPMLFGPEPEKPLPAAASRRPYAQLARLTEASHKVLERDRKRIKHLKRRVLRLRRRVREALIVIKSLSK